MFRNIPINCIHSILKHTSIISPIVVVTHFCKNLTDIHDFMMLFMAIELKHSRVNIGTQLRSAVAFGAKAVITIGSTKYGCHGSFGASSHIPVIHFFTWDECAIFAKLMDCVFYGVSQVPDKSEKSGSMQNHEYHQNAIYIINSTGKLSEQEMSLCDKIFSLILPDDCDPSVYTTINYEGSIGACLHYYTSSIPVAMEREFTGEKFNIEWTSDYSDTILDAATNAMVTRAKEQYTSEHMNANDSHNNEIQVDDDDVLSELFGFAVCEEEDT